MNENQLLRIYYKSDWWPKQKLSGEYDYILVFQKDVDCCLEEMSKLRLLPIKITSDIDQSKPPNWIQKIAAEKKGAKQESLALLNKIIKRT